MKLIGRPILTIALLFIVEFLYAATSIESMAPGKLKGDFNNEQPKYTSSRDFRIWITKSYQSITGRKITLKHKIALKLLQWKVTRLMHKSVEITPRQKKLAQLSVIFGAGSFALLFIPFLGILAVPSAITAIILGIISLKGNKNTNGILGVVLGSAFFVLLFLLILILVAVFGGFL